MPDTEEDLLSTITSTVLSISDEIARYAQTLGDYSQDAADKLERGFDSYADSIRSTIRSNSWVPDSMKPPAPNPPPPSQIPLGFLQRSVNWIDRNRAISAAIVGFAGTTIFLIYRHRKLSRRKRRARRASSGAKTEVVILAGSAYAHTTKSIALDLEKRGFLIYIPVGSLEEEAAISELRTTNIHSLNFDVSSLESTSEMLEKMKSILYRPNRHGTDRLHLASLVVVESFSTALDSGPTQNISSLSWSNAMVSHVIYPISIIQTFLPLLVTESITCKVDQQPTTLVVVTPSNISSINAPNHAKESVTTAALTSYISTLRLELPLSLGLTHIRLGSLANHARPSNRLEVALERVKKYTPSSPSPLSSKTSSPSRLPADASETNLYNQSLETRKLHYGVFDAVVGRTHGTVFLGRGALLYAIAGTLLPSGVVGWMTRLQINKHKIEQIASPTKNSFSSTSREWEDIREH